MPFTKKYTNLRTVLLTLPCLVLVQPTVRCQGSVTGTLALSAVDVLATPASARTTGAPTIAVWPAPYGLTEYTRSVLAVPLTFGGVWPIHVIALDGMASSSWIDLSVKGAGHWRVSSSYRLGACADVRWMRAAGFPANVQARIAVHAAADVDSAWTLGFGVDELLSWTTHGDVPNRSLRIGLAWRGDVTATIDIEASPTRASGILLGLRLDPYEDIIVRGTLRTEPLTSSLAVGFAVVRSLPMVINLDYVQHVGIRTGIAVEFR